MTPAMQLRQALKVRIAPLLKDLRASDRAFWGRYDGNGCSLYRSEFRPKEDGYLEVTGPIVADKVEADADALVEATAVDLELMLEELVPAEFHAVTLADAELIKRWPWSEQTEAGQWVLLWGGGVPVPSIHPGRDGVTPEEVAAWMLPALKRRDHPLANDGPEDIPVERWEAWSAERQRRVNEISAKMNTPLTEQWMELNAELEEVERQHMARMTEWIGRAEHSLMKAARGFTYPNNKTKWSPMLPTLWLNHPKTGGRWVWWPEAIEALYLANPATVAARCVRALERLNTRKTEEVHTATAHTVLTELNVAEENMGRLAGDLADELRKRVAEARALLDVDAALESIRKASGHTMLPWDEKAAAFYEGLSTDHAQGTAVADALRTAAHTRWTTGTGLFHLWTPQQPHSVPRFALNLAKVLWKDVVAPRTQREHQKPAALVRAVHIQVVDLLRPGSTFKDNHLMDKDGRQLMLLTRMSALDDVPAMEMEAIPKLLKRGVQLFGSIQAHRTVRHFVTEGHRRVLAGEADARRLQYDGGWARMAQDAGISESEEARAIVLALAHVPFVGPNSEHGNLLSYTWRPHAPGRKALVSVVLGDMLLPGFVHALTGKTRSTTEARQLVPVVDLPGFVGRKNEHGAQATLQMLVLAELRRRAVELASTGAVRFTDAMWRDLVEQAGLPPGNLARVLDRWTHDGDGAPAFLVRVDRDRWTLAVPAYSAALDYLVAAGRDSQQASVAGKASRRVAGKRRGKTAKVTGA